MSDNKVIVLGIDGMDPKMTRRLVDEGRLPNIEKLIKQGGARHDLVLLGGVPNHYPADVDHFGYRRISKHPWCNLLLELSSNRIRSFGIRF